MTDRGQEIAKYLIAAAGTLLILWMEAPDWQRKQAAMTATHLAARVTARPHRAAGHAGMTAELAAGREDAAVLPYSLARFVGQVREWARRSYEGMAA